MKKFDPEPIIGLCQLILPLQYPLKVKVYGNQIKGYGDSEGIYTYKNKNEALSCHLIFVRTKGITRGLDSILAHEYAHAVCQEKHPKAKDHKRSFQRIAKKIEKGLKLLGIDTGPLYLPEFDE